MAIPSDAGIYLVRVTTDDREHQLWAAAAASQEEAINLVLKAVSDGWTAAPLSNRLKPAEIEALNMKVGEVRELTPNRPDRAPRAN
jgi:hypothetical protein